MPLIMIVFVVIAVGVRLAALGISIRNEKRLREAGAVEYHALTSGFLATAHILYYLFAIGEGFYRSEPMSVVTVVGLVLYVLAMLALVWVIRSLGRFWTVKVIVATDHELVTNKVFASIRHPNYFLNVLPELVGLALALQAWGTLLIGLPAYAVILYMRIRQEETVMRRRFADY